MWYVSFCSLSARTIQIIIMIIIMTTILIIIIIIIIIISSRSRIINYTNPYLSKVIVSKSRKIISKYFKHLAQLITFFFVDSFHMKVYEE